MEYLIQSCYGDLTIVSKDEVMRIASGEGIELEEQELVEGVRMTQSKSSAILT